MTEDTAENFERVSATLDRAVLAIFGQKFRLYKEYRPHFDSLECTVYYPYNGEEIRVDFLVFLYNTNQQIWYVVEYAGRHSLLN